MKERTLSENFPLGLFRPDNIFIRTNTFLMGVLVEQVNVDKKCDGSLFFASRLNPAKFHSELNVVIYGRLSHDALKLSI